MMFRKQEFSRRQYKRSEYSWTSTGHVIQWMNGFILRIYDRCEDTSKLMKKMEKYGKSLEFFDVAEKCPMINSFRGTIIGEKITFKDHSCKGNLTYGKTSMICDECGIHFSRKETLKRLRRPRIKRDIHVDGKIKSAKERKKEYNKKYKKLKDVKKRISEEMREYYKKNREKIIQQNEKYRKDNVDKINKRRREHYQENSERLKREAMRYYYNHREEILAKHKEKRRNRK